MAGACAGRFSYRESVNSKFKELAISLKRPIVNKSFVYDNATVAVTFIRLGERRPCTSVRMSCVGKVALLLNLPDPISSASNNDEGVHCRPKRTGGYRHAISGHRACREVEASHHRLSGLRRCRCTIDNLPAGWPELSISWRHQLPVFAELGFRCVAPDMRGYGRSSVYGQHADYAVETVCAT
jgi:hypothetical protein